MSNDSVRSYDDVGIAILTVRAALSSSYSNALKGNVVVLIGVDSQTRELEIVATTANDKRVTWTVDPLADGFAGNLKLFQFVLSCICHLVVVLQ